MNIDKKVQDLLRKHLYNNGHKFMDIPTNKMEKAIKDAIKEALNIPVVIVPFYCVNKEVGYKDSICLDQCITCGMREKAQ